MFTLSVLSSFPSFFTAIECPCPPWFPDGSWGGTYDWSSLPSPFVCGDKMNRLLSELGDEENPFELYLQKKISGKK